MLKKYFSFQNIFIQKKMSSRFFDRVFGGVKNKKNILLLIFMFQSILIIFRLIYIFYTFLFIFVFRGVARHHACSLCNLELLCKCKFGGQASPRLKKFSIKFVESFLQLL